MTNTQQMRSDMVTMDRREAVDKTMRDNRERNDEMTAERRIKADKTLSDNRLRNDEITADRRELKDGNFNITLAVTLVGLIALAVGAFFIWI